MSVVGELDETAVEVVIDLALHLGFDLLENFVRIRHEQVLGMNLQLGKVPLMVRVNGLETVPFAGKVVPVGFRRMFEGGGEWIVGGVDGATVRGAGRDRHKGEGNLVMLTKANGRDGLGLGIPEEAEVLLHPGPVPTTVGDVFKLGRFDLPNQTRGIWEVVFGWWRAQLEPVLDRQTHAAGPREQVKPREKEPKGRAQESCGDAAQGQPEGQEGSGQESQRAQFSQNQGPARAQGNADDDTG